MAAGVDAPHGPRHGLDTTADMSNMQPGQKGGLEGQGRGCH